MINAITLLEKDCDTEFAMLEGVPRIDDALDGLHTTSFASKLPNATREIDIIRQWVNNPNAEEQPNTEEVLSFSWNWLISNQ